MTCEAWGNMRPQSESSQPAESHQGGVTPIAAVLQSVTADKIDFDLDH